MSELKITLPDALAEEAQDAGLLTPQAIERLLREAMRKSATERLFAAMDRMAAVNDPPPMTGEEIQAEIDAARRQRRAQG